MRGHFSILVCGAVALLLCHLACMMSWTCAPSSIKASPLRFLDMAQPLILLYCPHYEPGDSTHAMTKSMLARDGHYINMYLLP